MNSEILNLLNSITIICCIIIIGAALYFVGYIMYLRKEHMINKKRQWIEQMPTIVSTLGVLGTFLGITIGLYNFDTENLDKSIPLLLSGLKTAFITSLAGMAGSLLLTRVVNLVFDKVDSEEMEQDKMLRLITAMTAIQTYLSGDETKKFKNNLLQQSTDTAKHLSETIGILTKISENIQGMSENMQEMKDDIEEIKGQCNEINEKVGAENAESHEIKRLIGVAVTATESITRIDNTVSDMKEITESISDNLQSCAAEIEEVRSHLATSEEDEY